MTIDSDTQRKIMGMFATGITVVSMRISDDETWGMTANAFTSLSLDPPLVLVAVKKGQTHENLQKAGHFAINILSADQQDISDRFAFTGPKDFSGLNTTTDVTGAPILQNTLGYVNCEIHEVLAGGDHDIFIGKIIGGKLGEGTPLLYFSGGYANLASES